MSDDHTPTLLPPPPPPSPEPAAVPTPTSDEIEYRDIHALTPTPTPPARSLPRPSSWDTISRRSSGLSDEQLMTMSREFTAMVAAGSTMQTTNDNNSTGNNNNDMSMSALARIGEDDLAETNPLAIVPDTNPIASPRSRDHMGESSGLVPAEEVSVVQVKREEVETKVAAWQTAEMAKINNRFKREEVVINGWESEQVHKATAWLKKIEVSFF